MNDYEHFLLEIGKNPPQIEVIIDRLLFEVDMLRDRVERLEQGGRVC